PHSPTPPSSQLLSLHDALPICLRHDAGGRWDRLSGGAGFGACRALAPLRARGARSRGVRARRHAAHAGGVRRRLRSGPTRFPRGSGAGTPLRVAAPAGGAATAHHASALCLAEPTLQRGNQAWVPARAPASLTPTPPAPDTARTTDPK